MEPTSLETEPILTPQDPVPINLHQKARFEKPDSYPDRFPVPDESVSFMVEYPQYCPPYFVASVVLANDMTTNPRGWADPENLAQITRKLESYEGEISFDEKGKPLNPRGRTGIVGRGLLGKWGPNFAADPIITRINSETGQLEMIAIERRDNNQLAIPGGMVEKDSDVPRTLRDELQQETGVVLSMDEAVEVYRGYVDDPRNTDNAWMETTAKHLHLDEATAGKLNLVAGDDAKAVRWLPLTRQNLDNLYASHGELVKKALIQFYTRSISTIPDIARADIEEMLATR